MSAHFKRILQLSVLTLFISVSTAAFDQPQVVNSKESLVFIPGKEVIAAFKKIPGPFRLLEKKEIALEILDLFSEIETHQNQIPWAVTGYFNNDDVLDVIVMGLGRNRGKPQVKVYLIESNPARGKYQAKFLDYFEVSRSQGPGRWQEGMTLSNWKVYLRKGKPDEQRHYLGGLGKDLGVSEVFLGPSAFYGLKARKVQKLNP